VLDCSKYASLGLGPLPDWRDAVARFVNEEADL
jgi:dTDP-4-dehydrorhamnose reductase